MYVCTLYGTCNLYRYKSAYVGIYVYLYILFSTLLIIALEISKTQLQINLTDTSVSSMYSCVYMYVCIRTNILVILYALTFVCRLWQMRMRTPTPQQLSTLALRHLGTSAYSDLYVTFCGTPLVDVSHG